MSSDTLSLVHGACFEEDLLQIVTYVRIQNTLHTRLTALHLIQTCEKLKSQAALQTCALLKAPRRGNQSVCLKLPPCLIGIDVFTSLSVINCFPFPHHV